MKSNIHNSKVFFDTNVLLGLYDKDYEETTKIIESFKNMNDKIIFSYQVVEEFYRNYNSVKEGIISKSERLINEYTKLVKKTIKGIEGLYERNSVSDNEMLITFIDDFHNKLKDVNNDIGIISEKKASWKKGVKKYYESDIVFEYVKSIKKVTEKFSFNEELSIYNEGYMRYSLLMPPGYKDISKEKNSNSFDDRKRIFGDLIIWKDLLRYAKNSEENIIFVTNDNKTDWWENNGDKRINSLLLKEFKEYSKSNYYQMNLDDFLRELYLYSGDLLSFEPLVSKIVRKSIVEHLRLDELSEKGNIDNPYTDIIQNTIKSNTYLMYNIYLISNDYKTKYIDNLLEISGNTYFELSLGHENVEDRTLVPHLKLKIKCDYEVYYDIEDESIDKTDIVVLEVSELKDLLDIDIYDLYDIKYGYNSEFIEVKYEDEYNDYKNMTKGISFETWDDDKTYKL